jgi:hypothetical protein
MNGKAPTRERARDVFSFLDEEKAKDKTRKLSDSTCTDTVELVVTQDSTVCIQSHKQLHQGF